MTFFGLLLLSSLAWSQSPSAPSPTPSEAEILDWLENKDATGRVGVKSIHRITLRGGERAYLAEAYFPDSGRNFSEGYVLARPALRKARALGNEFRTLVAGVTTQGQVALLLRMESGQGSTHSIHFLAAFDGWDVKTVFTAPESYENSGDCGHPEIVPRPCVNMETFLNFSHSGLAVTRLSWSGQTRETMALDNMAVEYVRIKLPWD